MEEVQTRKADGIHPGMGAFTFKLADMGSILEPYIDKVDMLLGVSRSNISEKMEETKTKYSAKKAESKRVQRPESWHTVQRKEWRIAFSNNTPGLGGVKAQEEAWISNVFFLLFQSM